MSRAIHPQEADPVITREQAIDVAAQLLGVDPFRVSVRENPVGCWITVNPQGDEQYAFRGKTWFGALEAVHKFLIEAVKSNPELAEEAGEPEEDFQS